MYLAYVKMTNNLERKMLVVAQQIPTQRECLTDALFGWYKLWKRKRCTLPADSSTWDNRRCGKLYLGCIRAWTVGLVLHRASPCQWGATPSWRVQRDRSRACWMLTTADWYYIGYIARQHGTYVATPYDRTCKVTISSTRTCLAVWLVLASCFQANLLWRSGTKSPSPSDETGRTFPRTYARAPASSLVRASCNCAQRYRSELLTRHNHISLLLGLLDFYLTTIPRSCIHFIGIDRQWRSTWVCEYICTWIFQNKGLLVVVKNWEHVIATVRVRER